nr:MAG TPA: hypothetical protein [Caudoviricetes sp.]
MTKHILVWYTIYIRGKESEFLFNRWVYPSYI